MMGFRVSGCRFQVAGFRLQVSGCRLQVAGFRSERATYCWDSELLVMLLEQEVGEWNSERTGFVLNIRA